MIDIHTHVLPFVDDGSPDLETSIRMIQEEYENGVDAIIATPHHHYYRRFLKSKSEIEESFETLKAEIQKRQIPVQLYLGQEIFYHSGEDFADLLKRGEILPLNGSNTVLLEFSTSRQPEDLEEVIYSFNVNGYRVIIAHVERYEWMTYEKIKAIRSSKCRIQINAGSLVGKEVSFGKRLLLKKLLKEGLVDFVASDVHSFRPTMMSKAKEFVIKATKSEKIFEKTIESI